MQHLRFRTELRRMLPASDSSSLLFQAASFQSEFVDDIKRHALALQGMVTMSFKADGCYQAAHATVSFECETCGKIFKSKSSMDGHKRVHRPERESVVCEVCGKTFSQNSHLSSHMRIHNGDRPFECNLCRKQFSQKV
jgi:hypothetical protein